MSASRALSFAVPFVLCTAGSAQTVLLRFKPAVGTKVSYVLSTTMQQSLPNMPSGMNSTTVVPMVMRIVSRSGKMTTVETKTGTAKVTVDAKSPMAGMKPMMEKMLTNMTVNSVSDDLGNQKSTAASGGGGMMGSMNQSSQAITFPTAPVRVGGTWSSTLDMEKLVGSMAKSGITASGKIPISYRLVSLKKVGSRTLATITTTMNGKTTMTMPQGKMDMTMKGSGTSVVDIATGMFVSNSMVSDTTMAVMGQNMKQHMVMSMKSK